MKRAQQLLGIVPSDSPDVKAYILYWDKSKQDDGSDTVLNNDAEKGPVTANSANVGIPTETREIDGQTVLVLNLATVEALKSLPEGEYDFGAAAFDGLNESDIVEAEDVTVDITPPNPPGKVFAITTP